MKNKKFHLTIGWLYPELMNIYGDRGNIMILKNRCIYRSISVDIKLISLVDTPEEIGGMDILFMGGAQDKQQSIIRADFKAKKDFIKEAIEKGTPAIFICGAYQLLGKYYITAQGDRIEGSGIMDFYTENPGLGNKRLVGNIILRPSVSGLRNSPIIGFENHGGRTYLGTGTKPFGDVIRGYGNNGQDFTEGVCCKNTIGTYLHGPLLAVNPSLADWFIKKAIEKKYGLEIKLEPMDDSFELNARRKCLYY